MKTLKKLLALAIISILSITTASAASVQGTLTVTGTAVGSCTVTNQSASFGTFSVDNHVDHSTPFTVSVTCPSGLAYSLTSDASSYQATVGADSSSYFVYLKDSAGTAVNSSSLLAGTGIGSAQTLNLAMTIGTATEQPITTTGAITATAGYSVNY